MVNGTDENTHGDDAHGNAIAGAACAAARAVALAVWSWEAVVIYDRDYAHNC